jgi:tetratricopeptide (TPR) repeat protein
MRKPRKRRRSLADRQEQDPAGPYAFSIKITFDDDFHPYGFEVTDEIYDAVETYLRLCKENPTKAARELPAVIERHPQVPQLRNYLVTSLKLLGRLEEAYAVNDQALRDHPEYIYAVTNKAIQYWEKKEYDEVERFLGGQPLSINRTFPKRKIFHVSEVFAYYTFMIRLEVSKGNPDIAESFYNLLYELDPDHPELPDLKELIDIHSLKNIFSNLMASLKKTEKGRAKRNKRAPGQKPKMKRDPDQGDLFE